MAMLVCAAGEVLMSETWARAKITQNASRQCAACHASFTDAITRGSEKAGTIVSFTWAISSHRKQHRSYFCSLLQIAADSEWKSQNILSAMRKNYPRCLLIGVSSLIIHSFAERSGYLPRWIDDVPCQMNCFPVYWFLSPTVFWCIAYLAALFVSLSGRSRYGHRFWKYRKDESSA